MYQIRKYGHEFAQHKAARQTRASGAYSEYVEGARRMDEEMVMTWLENNANARANNPILDSFYLAENSTIVGQLNAVDLQISRLNDSTLRSTPTAWMTAYNLAHSMNNALAGTEVFEQNAKRMNSLYLNSLLQGNTILTEVDEADIETLAFTCPYTGGNAVYRARVLYGMKHWGIHYDELEICNGQGVYKGGISKLQEQLNQLANNNSTNQNFNRFQKEDEIIVYPNPATTEITIEYYFDKYEIADFVVYDLLGREQFRTKLYGDVRNKKIGTSKLLNGVYLYKITKLDKSTYTGKLIIE